MKILHTVEYYSPSVGGAQEVVKQISEHLVRMGHDVTVATSELAQREKSTINGVKVQEFSISGKEVSGFRGEVERYHEFLLDGRFDIMMNYATQQWATDLVFPILDLLPYRKILAPCGFSGLFNPQYSSYFMKMPRIMKKYDHLIFHSHIYRDIEFARSKGQIHCTVIPNGASETEFRNIDLTFKKRYGIPENIPLLLTVGSHTGLKGHDLVIEAFRKAEIGKSVLMIIGNVHTNKGCLPDCKRRALLVKLVSFGRKHVILLDPPREDVLAAYHATDLFVFGSKIECSPLVLFEAMATKTPFITTACGNAKEIVNWGHGGIVVPTKQNPDGSIEVNPDVMSRHIEDLFMNPNERHHLGESGYKAWQEKFTWEKIAIQYEQLYSKLMNSPS